MRKSSISVAAPVSPASRWPNTDTVDSMASTFPLVADLNQSLQRETDSYDGVISSGTFTHGHVGPEPLDEVFRVLKPGGILACTVHMDLWQTKGFEVKFKALVDQGIARLISKDEGSYYRDGAIEGWFCVYQKNPG
jgi:SAM-dependent methyltransferase